MNAFRAPPRSVTTRVEHCAMVLDVDLAPVSFALTHDGGIANNGFDGSTNQTSLQPWFAWVRAARCTAGMAFAGLRVLLYR
jgi:hypothetical protein